MGALLYNHYILYQIYCQELFSKIGRCRGNRTLIILIKSQFLYHLSYTSITINIRLSTLFAGLAILCSIAELFTYNTLITEPYGFFVATDY